MSSSGFRIPWSRPRRPPDANASVRSNDDEDDQVEGEQRHVRFGDQHLDDMFRDPNDDFRDPIVGFDEESGRPINVSDLEQGRSVDISGRSSSPYGEASPPTLSPPRRVTPRQQGVGTAPRASATRSTSSSEPLHTVPPLPSIEEITPMEAQVQPMEEDRFDTRTNTENELSEPPGFVSRYTRAIMRQEQPKAFMAWEARVNRGMPEPKFKRVSQDLSDEALLLDTQDLYRLLERFARCLLDLDLAYGLTMIDNINWDNPRETILHGPSLLKSNAFLSWTVDDVARTQAFYMMHGTPVILDTQKRLCRFILESMEPTLRLRVESLLYNVWSRPIYHGGLLAFKLLMDQLTINTYDMRHKLTHLLEKIDIKDYAGQHVPTVVDRIEPLLTRLDGSLQRQWPHDLVYKLLRVFQTTSCDEFNKHFEDSERALRGSTLGVLAAQRTAFVEDFANLDALLEICADAKAQYHTISAEKEWNYKGGSASVYTGTTATLVPHKCWNCGSETHQLKECPKPRNQATIDANKKLFEATKKKLADQKKKAGTGNHQPRQPPGRTQGRKWVERSPELMKRQPQKDEPHTQLVNGHVHFWCGRHGEHCYWNPTHLTKDHKAWMAKVEAEGKAAPPEHVQANTAGVPSISVLEQAFSSWK